MISISAFTKLANSFPEVTQQPHFEKTSFRIAKKIFATLDIKNMQACVKLSAIDQNVFSTFDKNIIFPLPNKWGLQGWTMVELQKIPKGMCEDILKTAYVHVAPKG